MRRASMFLVCLPWGLMGAAHAVEGLPTDPPSQAPASASAFPAGQEEIEQRLKEAPPEIPLKQKKFSGLSADELESEAKKNPSNSYLCNLLGEKDPLRALRLADEIRTGEDPMSLAKNRALKRYPLRLWSESDPKAAIAWFEQHYPLSGRDNKRATDPNRSEIEGALFKGLMISDPETVQLRFAAMSAEHRDRVLRSMGFMIPPDCERLYADLVRRYVPQDQQKELLRIRAYFQSMEGYDSYSAFLDQIKADPEEKTAIIEKALETMIPSADAPHFAARFDLAREWLAKVAPGHADQFTGKLLGTKTSYEYGAPYVLALRYHQQTGKDNVLAAFLLHENAMRYRTIALSYAEKLTDPALRNSIQEQIRASQNQVDPRYTLKQLELIELPTLPVSQPPDAIRNLADRLLAAYREKRISVLLREGLVSDEVIDRQIAVWEEVKALDAEALRALAVELQVRPLSESAASDVNVVLQSALMLQPVETVLNLLITPPTCFGIGQEQATITALISVASRAPKQVSEWFLQSDQPIPISDEKALMGIVRGVAQKNPGVAFVLIGRIQLKPEIAAIAIGSSVKSEADQTEILHAMRSYLSHRNDPELRKRITEATLRTMAYNITARDGYSVVEPWVRKVALTKDECAAFAQGIMTMGVTHQKELGAWLEWIARELPEESATKLIRQKMQEWARSGGSSYGSDPGEWISKQPDGMARKAALVPYIESLAEREPKIAAQFALGLPDGEERTKLLRTVLATWRMHNPSEADEFARAQKMFETPQSNGTKDRRN